MTIHRHADFAQLADAGFHAPDALAWLATDEAGARLAMDAQPGMVTQSNNGIPAFLGAVVDPNLVRVAFAPMKAEEIWGPARQLGSWESTTAMFAMVEYAGETSSYGDWNNNGMASLNAQFPQRQNYLYQTICIWGELEMARAALAKINWASEKSESAAYVLNRFANNAYFFGLSGLQAYGFLNDPSLGASIQPGPKAFNTQAHGPWMTGTVVTAAPTEIYADVQSLVIQLITQSQGLIDISTPMVLAVPPAEEGALTATNSFGFNLADQLKKAFPNLRIVSAPQYTTAAGNVAQLFATSVNGQDTGFLAYSERLRLHPVVIGLSAYEQKRSAGVWGAIIRQPFAVASMLGI